MFNVILGGHYCLSEELSDLSSDSEAEISTWRHSLSLFKEVPQDSMLLL